MLNGKPIQMEAHILLNQIPANSIKKVELIPAPSAKFDPEGKAGIINIVTDPEIFNDGWYLQLNTRLGAPSIEGYNNAENTPRYGGDFTLNFQQKKWNISLSGSYLRYDISGRRIGDVYTMQNDTLVRFPSEGERSFDEENYSGRLNAIFQPNKQHQLEFGFFGGKRTKERTADILYFDNRAEVGEDRVYTMQYFNENLRIRRGDFALGSLTYTHRSNNQSTFSTSFLYEYTMLGGPTTNRNLEWPATERVQQNEFNTNDNPLNGIRLQVDYSSPDLS